MGSTRALTAVLGCLLVVSLTGLVQWLAPANVPEPEARTHLAATDLTSFGFDRDTRKHSAASVLMAQATVEATQPRGCTAGAGEPAPLPTPVQEMRDAILAAVHSGDIEDLRIALEWNELRPHLADEPVEDPIAYWKRISGDGEGREILAVLSEILECDHAALPIGDDVENNLVYVWPALSEADLSQLTPQQEVALYRLVSPAEAKAMRESRRWQWWRLAIGADGTWHAFHRAK